MGIKERETLEIVALIESLFGKKSKFISSSIIGNLVILFNFSISGQYIKKLVNFIKEIFYKTTIIDVISIRPQCIPLRSTKM